MKSLRLKILTAILGMIGFSLVMTGSISTYNFLNISSEFDSFLKKRHYDLERNARDNSLRIHDKFSTTLEEQTLLSGRSLIEKDSMILKNPFLENSIMYVRDLVRKSLKSDPNILHGSFFVLDRGVIKAWQYLTKQGEQLPLKNFYDLKNGKWMFDGESGPTSIADDRVKDLIQVASPTVRKIEYQHDGGIIQVYEAITPIFDGEPDEFESIKRSGQPIGFLRYVISLETLMSALKAEEQNAQAFIEAQRQDNKIAEQQASKSARLVMYSALITMALASLCFAGIASAIASSIARKLTNPLFQLMKASQTISKGDYSQDISVRTGDEIEQLATSFNEMRKQVRIFTENLQTLVQARTADLEKALEEVSLKRQKMKEILNHIEQGIVTVDENLEIDSEYSRYMTELFPDTQINGASVMSLIFTGTDMSPEQKQTVSDVLQVLLGESMFSWSANSEQLPKKIKFIHRNVTKSYEISWNPMLDDSGTVKQILIAIKDLTSQLELEEKLRAISTHNTKMVDVISQVVAQKQETVVACMKDAKKRVARIETQLLSEIDQDAVFVDLHTLKGAFRTLRFKELSNLCHICEEALVSQRDDGSRDIDDFSVKFYELKEEVDRFVDVLVKVLNVNVEGATHSYRSLAQIMAESFEEARRLAAVYDLGIQSFTLDDHVIDWSQSDLMQISKIMLHALTNAIDHGYYLPIKEGRMERRNIALAIKAYWNQEGSKRTLEFCDEGAGFNKEYLKRLAIREGHDWTLEKDLYALVFAERVSTAAQVSDTSGRGVGLSAIKNLAEHIGGEVHLVENNTRGLRLIMTFSH